MRDNLLKIVLLAAVVLTAAACGSGGNADWERRAQASPNRGVGGEK